MIIKTYQSKKVLDILLNNEIYRASFENTDHSEKYKYLSDMLYNDDTICPIFGVCPEKSNGIKTYGRKNDTLLILDVPEEECRFMEYYEWTDFMYFSDFCINNNYKNINSDEITQKQYDLLIKNIIDGFAYNTYGDIFDYNQTVLKYIKPEWLINKKGDN